jgi:TRAP-type mannitol/chloroaromatic compound transport system permease small subunit
MEGILRLADLINEIVGRVVSFLVVAITLIVVYDITARNVFGMPTQWVFELTKQLYAAHFILLGGYALLHDSHIRVEVVREHLSERLKHILEIIGYIVFFFPFIAVMLWYGWRFAMRSWAAGETTWGVFQIPVYPIKTAIVVAAVLLLIQALAQFVRSVVYLARTR